VLRTGQDYPELSIDQYLVTRDGFVDRLRTVGMAALQLRPEGLEVELLDLATFLGGAMEEVDKWTRNDASYEGAILRINDRPDAPAGEAGQVCSGAPLLWHIDQAFRTLDVRPTYASLGCEIPPEPGSGGETIFSSAEDVVNELDDDQKELLRASKQRLPNGKVGAEPILIDFWGRPAIAIHSPGECGRGWGLETKLPVSDTDVKLTLDALYESLDSHARKVVWAPGLTWIWVNAWFPHARLARTPIDLPSNRSLRRMKARPMSLG